MSPRRRRRSRRRRFLIFFCNPSAGAALIGDLSQNSFVPVLNGFLAISRRRHILFHRVKKVYDMLNKLYDVLNLGFFYKK